MACDDTVLPCSVNDIAVGSPAARSLTSRPETVTVPISSLKTGISPRLDGENKAHIAWLAETEMPLPPILVDRRSGLVIDGMHRLMAATLKGREDIEVQYFDGTEAEAFLRAVEANVRHGLPLSQADRRAAAARIVASHPQMSDRAIAESTGLAARTVASIRRRSTDAVPQLNARVGKDGKVRPLNGLEGRRRAADLLAESPNASLREIAQRAGISLATAHDVRKRLEHGQEAGSVRRTSASHESSAGQGRLAADALHANWKAKPTPLTVLEKLRRDPSIRHSEQGRWLLRWLQDRAFGAQERPRVIATVPPHCTALVSQLARHYARMWLAFAQELEDYARSLDADEEKANLRHVLSA